MKQKIRNFSAHFEKLAVNEWYVKQFPNCPRFADDCLTNDSNLFHECERERHSKVPLLQTKKDFVAVLGVLQVSAVGTECRKSRLMLSGRNFSKLFFWKVRIILVSSRAQSQPSNPLQCDAAADTTTARKNRRVAISRAFSGKSLEGVQRPLPRISHQQTDSKPLVWPSKHSICEGRKPPSCEGIWPPDTVQPLPNEKAANRARTWFCNNFKTGQIARRPPIHKHCAI